MSKKQASATQLNPISLTQTNPCHHPPEQSESAKASRQEQIIDNLNRDNIHEYLRGLEVTSLTQQMAGGITRSSAEKIAQGLKSGIIHIPKNPPPLPEKNSHPSHLSSEEVRELQNRARRQIMAKKIDYLYEQIRGESPKEREQSGNLQVDFKEILTKEEHQRRMREIVQDKLQRKKRMAELHEETEKKRREEEQRQLAMMKLQEEKEKEIKRIKIQEKIKRRKQQHLKSVQMKTLLQKQLAKAKDSSRLYEQMEERYNSQILLPSLQQKKNKLKQIRDFHKRYDVETIKDHQKQYLQKSVEKSQQRRTNSPQWKYEPPSRTERLSKMLNDEQIMKKQQLQFRRKKLDQMKKRQQIYRMELKEKHQPIVDEDKRKEIEERLIRERRKYDKMHPDIDKKKLGEAYLQIAKRLKRPQSVKDPHCNEQSKLLQQKQQSQPLLPRANHTHQFYEQVRRKKIENIIHSQQKTSSEKFMMLKMQSQKLGEKLRQKEELVRYQGDEQAKNDAAQLLLSSIKAKMGIMDILKNSRNYTEDST